MDFNFNPEQEQLRDAVRRYVEKSYGFEQRCAIVHAGGFSRQAYSALVELGLTGLPISEAFGGLGMGPIEAMLALEALGRANTLEPLAAMWLASQLLERFAPIAVNQIELPRLVGGQAIIVLAQQERQARYNWMQCATTAQSSAIGFSVTGTKHLVPIGAAADAYIVPAVFNEKLALFLVQRRTEGVRAKEYLMQNGSCAADIEFNNAQAQLITTDGQTALALAQDIGVAHTCAFAVGVMDKTLELTTTYLKTRHQFGQPLANFQALRHRIADMKLQLELARSMSYFANMKLSSSAAERTRACSQAKCQLGQSMRFVGQQAVQLHGGIGLTDEYMLSHYFKTLTFLELCCGDQSFHLARVVDQLHLASGVIS